MPNLLSSKIETNETAALATLRQVAQSQMMFANRKEADLNQNGTGEYGTFGEMSGNVAVRAASGGTRFLTPNVIQASFRAISPLGEMYRSGYYYRLYLPKAGGAGVIELPGGGADAAVDPEQAESIWCVYAWPQRFGVTGNKTFFINQHGDITFTENSAYSGPGAPIPAGAALSAGGPAGSIVGAVAVGEEGRDSNTWRISGK